VTCPIYLVDDDLAITDSVSWLLEGEGFDVSSFNSAKAFLQEVDISTPCVALLDINMPGMDGMQVQELLTERGSNVSVVFLTGHADVETTKLAFKRGAHDLLQKPVQADLLCDVLRQAQTLATNAFITKQKTEALEHCVEQLTEREISLIPLIIEGKANKAIAEELCIALRTVEIHRHNLFKKMGVSSGIQLAFHGEKLLKLLSMR
jgi:FixJ family two-component response regulator